MNEMKKLIKKAKQYIEATDDFKGRAAEVFIDDLEKEEVEELSYYERIEKSFKERKEFLENDTNSPLYLATSSGWRFGKHDCLNITTNPKPFSIHYWFVDIPPELADVPDKIMERCYKREFNLDMTATQIETEDLKLKKSVMQELIKEQQKINKEQQKKRDKQRVKRKKDKANKKRNK